MINRYLFIAYFKLFFTHNPTLGGHNLSKNEHSRRLFKLPDVLFVTEHLEQIKDDYNTEFTEVCQEHTWDVTDVIVLEEDEGLLDFLIFQSPDHIVLYRNINIGYILYDNIGVVFTKVDRCDETLAKSNN